VAHKSDYKVVEIEKKEPLKEELKHFIHCVENRKKPETDGEEGLRVLRVLDLCQKSLEKRKDIGKGDKEKYFVHPSSIIE
jgi:UDP-2-acetamido-3-amino-2,3-dideoxy-glucuronate N-acetyltransferase